MGKGEVACCHVEVQVHRRATVVAAQRNPQITQHSVAHGQRLPTKRAGSAVCACALAGGRTGNCGGTATNSAFIDRRGELKMLKTEPASPRTSYGAPSAPLKSIRETPWSKACAVRASSRAQLVKAEIRLG
jgi:hypothetical protein